MALSVLAKRMIIIILIISAACILGSLLYYRSLGFLPFLFGILLGSLSSIIKVFLLDRAVDKALTMEMKKAEQFIGFQHLLRLLFSAIVLVIGALVPYISLWGVVMGILAYQLAVYVANLGTGKSEEVKEIIKNAKEAKELDKLDKLDKSDELNEFEEFKKFRDSGEFKEFKEFKENKKSKENE